MSKESDRTFITSFNTVQDTFARLIVEKNFGEIVLVSWAYTEYMIDQFMVKQFKLENDDRKGREFISKLGFNEKWEYLKKCGIFTEREKEKISLLQSKRNKLFHSDLFNNPDYYSDDGRKRLIAIAKDSFYTVSEVFERKYIKLK
ncbi:MAG: hypothetical protein M1504_02845 [Candidatus Marsarchaeota archaeon]|nr:hypothetical protein [Candidatus Marsarchaeota archaeon]